MTKINAPVSPRHELMLAGVWLATLASVIVVLLAVRDSLDSATFALALLATSMIAAVGSLRLSIAAALVTAALFNVLFIPPYDSVRIESDASVVAFIVYPLVVVSLGLVVHRLRGQMLISHQRAREAALVRDLTIDLVRQDVWLQPPLAAALDDLHSALDLRGAALAVRIDGGEAFEVTSGDAARARAAARGEQSGAVDGISTWRVATASATYGLLAVDREDLDATVDERVARSFANVVALACERAGLVQRAIQQQTFEATDKARTALVQAVTHDLRTPLTSIRALASTLPTVGALTNEQTEIVLEVEEQAQRLTTLVDRVLDLGRIESGQLKLRLATLALDDVVHEAVDAFERPGTPDVVVIIEPDLPAVPIDEHLLVQVLVNLLENAQRHGEPPFEMVVARKGERLEVRVVDHGPGVPEAERRRLFEPGRAMRQSTADERAHGLGLAIAAGFVSAHHGHLRVDPTPGGGATFVVSLPEGSAS